MSAQFESPRQALAYMFSCRRGPAMSQLSYHNGSVGTGHSTWDAPVIGALLYGPNPGRVDATTGVWGEGCGVVPGGALDRELTEWALALTDPDTGHLLRPELSGRARDVLRQLRALMEVYDVKPTTEPARASDVARWTDPEGRTWARLRTHRPLAQRRPQSSG